MEYWDIYDANKQLTGREMKRNDWILKDDEYWELLLIERASILSQREL